MAGLESAPYRVLVVDDHPQNVLLAEAVLKASGYVVAKAFDGPGALAAVAQEPPDLILLDVMMPGLDGFTVTRRLKGERETRHIPIVLLTTLSSSEDRVAGIDAGADDFISKPFNRHELLARVRSLVRVKRLEETERRFMRRTLERYVDPSVAQVLLDDPQSSAALHPEPGGHRREASVLFADLRGFSSWAEQEPPEVVVEVLNLFLQAAVDVVFRHGGMIDKFMGDGVMALFGVPVAHPDHARRAVAAALDVQAAAADVQHPRLPGGLRVGCGVNAGEMVVGNIGSERRLDFTAIGNGVNLSKRLEEIAEAGQVLVTAETYARLGPATAQGLGERQVKGLATPVRVFNLTGLTPLPADPTSISGS